MACKQHMFIIRSIITAYPNKSNFLSAAHSQITQSTLPRLHRLRPKVLASQPRTSHLSTNSPFTHCNTQSLKQINAQALTSIKTSKRSLSSLALLASPRSEFPLTILQTKKRLFGQDAVTTCCHQCDMCET